VESVSEHPWSSSESVASIIPAMVKAIGATHDVAKGRRAKVPMKGGGEYSYAYADLAAVLDAIRPALLEQGLAVSQIAGNDGVRTVFVHTSGEWIAYPPLVVSTGQDTPQAQGSGITYARRYTLLAALGIATEDDDGRAAAQPATRRRAARVPSGADTDEMLVPPAIGKRAQSAFDEIHGLDVVAREAMRHWAAGRKLSVAAMVADTSWLELVESWLDERKAGS
jgi:hypothetical protein